MNRLLWTVVVLVGIGALMQISVAASIEQQLIVVTNDKTLNGNFRVGVQVKGTDLTVANTLGSATIDVVFDNTKLAYQNSTSSAFGATQGYSRSVTNNVTYIRVGVLGLSVNDTSSEFFPSNFGYDIGSTYVTWVQLNFKILDVNSNASLSIAPGSNAIGLFKYHANNDPKTGEIIDQTLSPPVNIDAPLPIQLASFTAGIAQQSGSVVLKWSTASEVNNYGYTVQRKSASEVDFADLQNAFVAGKGTTVDPQAYSFTDNTVAKAGTYTYRLKQQDLDGTIHYTQGVSVQVTLTDVAEVAPKVFQLMQNYPNPFNPSTQVKFSVETTGRAVVKVYNLIGAEVATLFEGTAEAGRYYVTKFDATRLASGIYFYRLATERKNDVKRMLLVK